MVQKGTILGDETLEHSSLLVELDFVCQWVFSSNAMLYTKGSQVGKKVLFLKQVIADSI
jgi:hypothetical protein